VGGGLGSVGGGGTGVWGGGGGGGGEGGGGGGGGGVPGPSVVLCKRSKQTSSLMRDW